mmetsp:Transcript_26902/g.52160  ORF Transcript_26902/g.52160 Transcript_26902/m.52160 type:complete len:214 (-) Transcript_26902:875-1516(-)
MLDFQSKIASQIVASEEARIRVMLSCHLRAFALSTLSCSVKFTVGGVRGKLLGRSITRPSRTSSRVYFALTWPIMSEFESTIRPEILRDDSSVPLLLLGSISSSLSSPLDEDPILRVYSWTDKIWRLAVFLVNRCLVTLEIATDTALSEPAQYFLAREGKVMSMFWYISQANMPNKTGPTAACFAWYALSLGVALEILISSLGQSLRRCSTET